MVAQDFIDLLNHWNFEQGNRLTDFADAYSSIWTYAISSLFAIIMMMRTYVLTPIECHAPIEFSGSNFGSYINNYCFVEGSVAITSSQLRRQFPQTQDEWAIASEKGKINYYPWLPLFLSLNSVIPALIGIYWKVFYTRLTGTNFQGLLDLAIDAQIQEERERKLIVERITNALDDAFTKNTQYKRGWFPDLKRRLFKTLKFGFLSKQYGSRVSFGYFMAKVFALANHIGSLVVMHYFLELPEDYRFFAFRVMHDMVNEKSWRQSMVFPRVTWCNVPIKHNRLNYNVVQCVLPGNLFAECFFVLLWIWHAFGIIITIISMIAWIIKTARQRSRSELIRKHLLLSGDISQCNEALEKKIKVFTVNYLRNDGVFLVRMLEKCAGTVITIDIVSNLWHRFTAVKDWSNLPRPYEFSGNEEHSSIFGIPKAGRIVHKETVAGIQLELGDSNDTETVPRTEMEFFKGKETCEENV